MMSTTIIINLGTLLQWLQFILNYVILHLILKLASGNLQELKNVFTIHQMKTGVFNRAHLKNLKNCIL